MKRTNPQRSRVILIYFQNSIRNIFFESFVSLLLKKGYQVHFLTKCDRGILHDKMEALGVTTSYYNPGGSRLLRFIKHWIFFVRYNRKNKIDVVYPHLQLANLIAVLAQYFIRAKVFPCRHHVDEVMIVGNKTAIRIDKAINKLSRKIIAVSNAIKVHMVNKEGVHPDKIVVIPLGYNFDLHYKPDPVKVAGIRNQMSCELLLIVIARMSANKRHILALQVLDKLVKEGLDIKMMILDHGVEEQNLKVFVEKNKLQDKVLFTGFLHNTRDYVMAADLLLHPSIIEASNQVVRELGSLEKPVIACHGVGDFDEYIIPGENSFLVSKENTVSEMSDIIREYYYKKDELRQMGKRFRDTVLSKFSIGKVVDGYLELAD
jgi:glycosyltransferase involved in cell wall biosynthesis